MSILLCRLFHSLHQRPKTIVALTMVITLWALFMITQLEWRLTLLDLFPKKHPSIKTARELQDSFGGFGTLIVIAHSPDSSQNSLFISDLEKRLRGNKAINFIEHKTEADFFEKNKLLYISLQDLEIVRDRVFEIADEYEKRKNPLIVQLVNNVRSDIDSIIPEKKLKLSDLEQKYSSSLKKHLGTEDKKILMLKIYPNFDVTDIQKSQRLFRSVKKTIREAAPPSSIEIVYAGEIYDNIIAEGKLLSEIKKSAWIPIAIIIALLLFFFYRQPMIPLLTVIPIGIGFIWTLGFIALTKNYLDLASIILGLIIVGLGVDSVIHMLSRYGEERRKGLGPEIAFENIIFETGPAVTVSSFTTAISFFTIALIPFQAFQTIGIYGGVGILLIWLSVMLTFPAILILLQKGHRFKVYGKRIYNHIQFKRRPFALWKYPIPFIAALFIFFGFYGYFPQFEYDFNKLGFLDENSEAQALLEQAGEENIEPVILITHSEEEMDSALSVLKNKFNQPGSTIKKIVTYKTLLPSDQAEKIEIIEEIKVALSPRLIARLSKENHATIEKITSAWNVTEITEKDLPLSFKRKFMGSNEKLTRFIFIFPKENTANGINARNFTKEVGKIHVGSRNLYATGKAILTADFLDLTLPHLGKVVVSTIFFIMLLLYIETRSLKNTLIIFGPVLLGGLLFIGILNFLDFQFNSINIIIFPLFLGLGSDATIHLFYRYQEEQSGSLFFVIQRTGASIIIALFTSIIGFTGLLFASHGGLKSLGLISLIVFGVILVVTYILFPVTMGYFDSSRWLKKLKRQQPKDEFYSANPPTFY